MVVSGWENNPRGMTRLDAICCRSRQRRRLGPRRVAGGRRDAAARVRSAAGCGALAAPDPAPAADPGPAPQRPPAAAADGAFAPAEGPYLGGADAGGSRHRVSFSVRGDRVRNLRIDGREMVARERIANRHIRTHHMGFELVAEWIDERHVEGKIKMRGRWNRGLSFAFTARHRVGDVLSG